MPEPKADAVQKTGETEDDFCPWKRSGVKSCPTPEPRPRTQHCLLNRQHGTTGH